MAHSARYGTGPREVSKQPVPTQRPMRQGVPGTGSGATAESLKSILASLPPLQVLPEPKPETLSGGGGSSVDESGDAVLEYRSPTQKMSAGAFLAIVASDIGIEGDVLLESQVVTQQDIDDINGGMYGFEHLEVYIDTVARRLVCEGFLSPRWWP